uniref:Glycosyl transferase n=1 Tax=uncultured bacterium 12-5D TaxID=1497524 RepID=A0A059U0F0_9BACT|nr:glycosyl transferase [uncultured bacterium 12-5D]
MSLESFIWILWSAWILQGVFCLYNIRAYPRLMRSQIASLNGSESPRQPAAVIVPIKGVTNLTEAFLEGLLQQDYPEYRIFFCFESDDDPAAQLLREELHLSRDETRHAPADGDAASGLEEVLLIAAGHATDCGQKVFNQIAAMRLIDENDQLIVFADADMLCSSDWLTRLTGPLNCETHQLSGAYRWFVPEDDKASTLFASVINASVATLGGQNRYHILWGGSMALTRAAYDKLDVPELFTGSLNDDLHLTRAARRAGMGSTYVRSLLIPTPISFTWASFTEFTRRQYFQIRHYMPKFYVAAIIGPSLYTIGWFSSAAAGLCGYSAAWIPWIIVNLFIDQPRAILRMRVVNTLFDTPHLERIKKTRLVEHLGTPLWMTVHALLAISALFMGKVCWAGITYRVFDRKKVEILSRADRETV